MSDNRLPAPAALRRPLAFAFALAAAALAAPQADATVMTATFTGSVISTDGTLAGFGVADPDELRGLPIEIVLRYDVRRAEVYEPYTEEERPLADGRIVQFKGESARGGGSFSPITFVAMTLNGVTSTFTRFSRSSLGAAYVEYPTFDVYHEVHYAAGAGDEAASIGDILSTFSLWIGFLGKDGSGLPFGITQDVFARFPGDPPRPVSHHHADLYFSTCVSEPTTCRTIDYMFVGVVVDTLHVVPLPPALPLLLGGLGGLALLRRRWPHRAAAPPRGRNLWQDT